MPDRAVQAHRVVVEQHLEQAAAAALGAQRVVDRQRVGRHQVVHDGRDRFALGHRLPGALHDAFPRRHPARLDQQQRPGDLLRPGRCRGDFRGDLVAARLPLGDEPVEHHDRDHQHQQQRTDDEQLRSDPHGTLPQAARRGAAITPWPRGGTRASSGATMAPR